MHGFHHVYGNEKQFVLIPIQDFPDLMQRQYRAHRERGLDTRALMQIALAYSHPFVFSDEPYSADEQDIVMRVRKILHQSDHLITSSQFHRMVHQSLDFLADVGPLLRSRLEFYTGLTDVAAIIYQSEDQFLVVGIQRRSPEYDCEHIPISGTHPQSVLRIEDKLPSRHTEDTPRPYRPHGTLLGALGHPRGR